MKTQNCDVTHLEWIISLDRRKRGVAHSMNGSTGSRMAHPTSKGISSGCKARATVRKLDISEGSSEHGAISKMRQDDPRTP
jgi:hypothetical protein